MDVVREEQVAFREEMDSVKSKIEQIFEAIQALARREEEAHVVAATRNDALVQGVALQSGPSVPIPNPVIYGLPPGFVPPPERTHVPPPAHTFGVADGVAVQGPPIVNQVVIPRTDEELQDEFEMQNYNGVTPMVIPTTAQDSEAILMCLKTGFIVCEAPGQCGIRASSRRRGACEDAQISKTIPPLLSPYNIFKRQRSVTRSIQNLISTNHPQMKEYVQSSRLDQYSLRATNQEQLILSLHGRKNQPIFCKITLLDSSYLHYENIVIGTVLTTLHSGSVILTIFPNYSASLNDNTLSTRLKVQVQITGTDQVPEAMSDTLHH
ncbi:hypothetical protein KIW84_075713 [Lathyrus oleraceus]|uniref:Uncharacterized protein n=1 Tax=Pisum sativum TaxID=3888 RepID=A0A9D4ZZU6_PEA|nr:hypothetical protein KIW84_075713 [Pisum sativum]